MAIRVNWGSGPDIRPGWWNTDRDPYPGLQYQGELTGGLPLEDDEAGLIVANHSLQMIPYPEMPSALGELRRILAPEGTIRVLVPDLLGAVRAFRRGDRAWFSFIADATEPTIGGKLVAYSTWYSTARQQFTPGWLCELLHRHGFHETAVSAVGLAILGHDSSTELDTRAHESIVVEAR